MLTELIDRPDGQELEIIDAVTQHQMTCLAWGRSEVIQAILHWMPRLVEEFKIHTPDFRVPELAFCIDKLPVRTMGYYRGSYNGYGLRREIAFNSEYIQQAEKGQSFEDTEAFYDMIGTLGHELVHAYQDITGTASKKRNHHNEEFRDIAATIGMVVARNGEQTYHENERFFDFLKSVKPNIKLPVLCGKPIPRQKKKKGKSTLKKWGCSCQKFYSGKSELFLRCTLRGCEQEVRLLNDGVTDISQAKTDVMSLLPANMD